MNYEEYLQQREILVSENQNLIGNVLNDAEKSAALRFETYKEALRAEDKNGRLYKMNLLLDRDLQTSALYTMLREMPKGSDLHVHATALIPAWKLMTFVARCPDLLVDVTDGHIYHRNENTYPVERCFPLAEIFEKSLMTSEELEKKWTLLGRPHKQSVWDYFENLLNLFESIEFDSDILYQYYVFAFEDYISCHIHHVEIHAVFSENRQRSFELAQIIKRAYFDVKKRHPELIVSIICAGLKYIGVAKEDIQTYFQNALCLREQLVDDFDPENPHPFILGFDLVNEEDQSVPLKELAPIFLTYKESDPDFQLYLHCGESLDAQSDNLIDGYLLGAKRVGHGMNLYRYPKLLQSYAEKEICLECCVISNQTLKYTKDIRLHPGAEYLKRGVTISLCSDDPVCQEHEQLTDDFFASVVCWNLSFADVKQLCINSILYSGVDQYQKSQMITSFKEDWEKFVEKYAKDA